MAQPTLSILIPITPDRLGTVLPLMAKIMGISVNWDIEDDKTEFTGKIMSKLYYTDVQLIFMCDNRKMTLGEKRQKLYEIADGLYSWQVDSDDDIADDAIEKILEVIRNNPNVDVVSFEEKCLINGELYASNFSNQYDDWEGDGQKLLSDGFYFHRTIFYKCVIKTKLARSVPFHHIRWGEDAQWAKDLKPHIKTEIHIPKQLYYYIHNSKPEEHNERYGFDKSTTADN